MVIRKRGKANYLFANFKNGQVLKLDKNENPEKNHNKKVIQIKIEGIILSCSPLCNELKISYSVEFFFDTTFNCIKKDYLLDNLFSQ